MDYLQPQLTIILLIADNQALNIWAVRHLSSDKFKFISCFRGKEGIEAFIKLRQVIVLIDF